ncbi:hypothetical protein VTK26DRAFT_5537 [Humicola hyalothermophila]
MRDQMRTSHILQARQTPVSPHTTLIVESVYNGRLAPPPGPALRTISPALELTSKRPGSRDRVAGNEAKERHVRNRSNSIRCLPKKKSERAVSMETIVLFYGGRARVLAKPKTFDELLNRACSVFDIKPDTIFYVSHRLPTGEMVTAELDPSAYHHIVKDGTSLRCGPVAEPAHALGAQVPLPSTVPGSWLPVGAYATYQTLGFQLPSYIPGALAMDPLGSNAGGVSVAEHNMPQQAHVSAAARPADPSAGNAEVGERAESRPGDHGIRNKDQQEAKTQPTTWGMWRPAHWKHSNSFSESETTEARPSSPSYEETTRPYEWPVISPEEWIRRQGGFTPSPPPKKTLAAAPPPPGGKSTRFADGDVYDVLARSPEGWRQKDHKEKASRLPKAPNSKAKKGSKGGCPGLWEQQSAWPNPGQVADTV